MNPKDHGRLALYQKKERGAVSCLLCPHRCRLQEGQHGICRVRENRRGKLWASSYGWVTALALDPIEKKPLACFHPGSRILSVGSWGCTLACPYCQNASIAHRWAPGREMAPETLADQALALQAQGNIGVAYTYNEPLLAYEFVYETAQAVQARGLVNVLVTNGFINPAPLQGLLPYIDAFNIDLKAFDDAFYRKVLGGSLAPVLACLTACVAAGKHVEVSFLVLADHNDDLEAFEVMCRWLADLSPAIPLHINRSFPSHHWQDLAPTPLDTMAAMQTIAQSYLSHVFLGNV